MPTYEYVCDACGHKFERFQRMTESPVKKCPKCGKGKARRLIGAGAGLIFKGSGFYITDYRSEDYKKQAKSESEAPKKPSEPTTTGPSTGEAKSDGAKPPSEKPAKPAADKSTKKSPKKEK